MGDFREEYPADRFRGGKCCKENRKYLWKKYILSALNKMLREKSYTVIYQGTKLCLQKILTQTKSLTPSTTTIKCSTQ